MSNLKKTWGTKGFCWYCGKSGIPTNMDHFYPKSKGGIITVHCCYPCNNEKKDMTPTEWISYLETQRGKREVDRSITATNSLLNLVFKYMVSPPLESYKNIPFVPEVTLEDRVRRLEELVKRLENTIDKLNI